MKPRFLLLILSWFAAAELKPRKGPAVVCRFKDKSFNPGETWHPHLEPFGLVYCLQCLCSQSGHVSCSSVKCPALSCPNPVAPPRTCCPRCSDQPRVPAALRASARSCRSNGTVYQSGETFTRQELFPSRSHNQCVMCTCSNGNIFCGLKSCPPLTCPSPAPLPDSCCLVCKDPSGSSSTEDVNLQLNRGVRHSVDRCSGAPPRLRTSPGGLSLSRLNLRGGSETTVKILLQRKQHRACVYNGRTYSDGDTWHPVLGGVRGGARGGVPGGVLECILCSCTDGQQVCKRIVCPGRLDCPRPLKAPGECCSTCPEPNRSEVNQSSCSGGFRPVLSVYKVWSSVAVDPPSSLRVLAVERSSSTEVEVQVWNTVDGVLQLMEIGDVERKDIKDHPENYTLLTTLDEEAWLQFKAEGADLSKAPLSRLCEDGIREMVTFLQPTHTQDRCPPSG